MATIVARVSEMGCVHVAESKNSDSSERFTWIQTIETKKTLGMIRNIYYFVLLHLHVEEAAFIQQT
jgi:hypothetical protein